MTTDDQKVKIGSIVQRPWGRYKLIVHEKDYSIKLLYIRPGECTSLQRHSKRHEFIMLLEGSINITHRGRTFTKDVSHIAFGYRIMAKEWHRFGVPACQKDDTILLEVAYGELDHADYERCEDKYNRPGKRGAGFID